MPRSNPHYTSRNDIIRMFLDGTAGEHYANGRLKTESAGDSIRLVAFHEKVLARYSESSGIVTIYAGHRNQSSETVRGYLEAVMEMAGELTGRYTVTSTQAPWTGAEVLTDSAQFIGNYVDWSTPFSSVERQAKRTVDEELKAHL